MTSASLSQRDAREATAWVYYELRGSTRAWRVVLIHWTRETTQLEWGGAAPGNLKTIDEVRSAMLSGLVKGSAGPW